MTSRTPQDEKSDAKAPEWRVEGMPEDEKKSSWRDRLPQGRWFWLVFLILLAGNWFITKNHDIKTQLTYRIGKNLDGVKDNDVDEIFLQAQYVF